MSAWADRSDEIDLISSAWVKATKEMKDVAKTKTANTGKFSYSYADLAEVLQMVRPILADHDLIITQSAESHQIAVVIWTTILHSSGQFITAQPTRLPTGETPQATGSAISYARRYAIMALLGLAADDDDGAEASAKPKKKSIPAGIVARTFEENEIRQMMLGMPKKELSEVRTAFVLRFGCGLSDLPEDRHPEAHRWMTEYLSAEKEG